jgi:hypothetical protein
MWVERTPEEIAKWQEATLRKARTDGLIIGIVGWVLGALVLSAGWVVSFASGFAAQRDIGGTFWTRLLVFGVVCAPIVFLARRVESRRAIRNAGLRTICPKCDTAAEGNAGAACRCGGTFVLLSTMKWVE